MSAAMQNLGKGRAAAFSAADMARLADHLGCHPATLEAIANVESQGFGWFKDGRMKILFEKHKFYKYLAPGSWRDQAVRDGLARKRWISPKNGGYKEQRTATQRYKILARAMEIDLTAALMSISMGRFQIMGFNYAACGFASVNQMWAKFLDSEANQLEAFGRLLVSFGLQTALRKNDFARIEKKYNGGGLKGAYAKRMAVENAKLLRGKWRNYQPGEADPPVTKPVKRAKVPTGAKAAGGVIAGGSAVLAAKPSLWPFVLGFVALVGVYFILRRKKKS